MRIDLKVLLMASVLLAALQGAAAKRSSMGRRTKSSSSGRSHSGRNSQQQQQHYAPAPAPKAAPAPPKPVEAPKKATNVAAAAPPKPAAPAATNQQPIGWNVGRQNPSAPVGPPPPYPGAGGGGHYYPGMGASPPAYSPKNAHPPPYSSLNHGHHSQSYSPYQQHSAPQMAHGVDSSRHYGLGPTNFGPSHGHNPYMSSGYGGYGGYAGHGGSPYAMGGGPTYYPGAGMGGFGGGMAAAPMMGGGLYGGYQQPKSSLFSLSNILTGVALYGTVRSLSGGGWGGGGYGSNYGYGGPREVHIYDHRERGSGDKAESTAINQAIGVPVANVSYVAPVIPATPTPLAPYPATGPPVTGAPVPEEIPQENFEDYPPQPKIYFGYGFAYGYGEYSVDSNSSSSTSSSSTEDGATKEQTEQTKEQPEATTSQKPSTGFSEENKLDYTTEASDQPTTSQESKEDDA